MSFSNREPPQNDERILNAATVAAYYRNKGIHCDGIRPFQRCIFEQSDPGVSSLFVMPTGYGKTMIADILAQNYLSKGKKVLFCVPFLALMSEQYAESKKKWPNLKELGNSYYVCKQFEKGATSNSIKSANVVFCTFERAKGVLMKLMKKNAGQVNDEIGMIVLDEVHMINDRERGAAVDWLIVLSKITQIPIIGMTGTLEAEGAILLAKYMNATLMYTKERSNSLPIRLFFSTSDIFRLKTWADQKKEGRPRVWRYRFYGDGKKIMDETTSLEISPDDLRTGMTFNNNGTTSWLTDVTVGLPPRTNVLSKMIEVELNKKYPEDDDLDPSVPADDMRRKTYHNGVLVYVTYKGILENYVAPPLSEDDDLPFDIPFGDASNSSEGSFPLPKIMCSESVQQQRNEAAATTGISNWNKMLFKFGAAIHCSSITTTTERNLIVDLFQKKIIRLIFCTSTLSAGVNLDALTLVIVSSTWRRKGAPITMNELIQTCGRAGRTPGYPGQAWIFYTLNDGLYQRDFERHHTEYLLQERNKKDEDEDPYDDTQVPARTQLSAGSKDIGQRRTMEANCGDLFDVMELSYFDQTSPFPESASIGEMRNAYTSRPCWLDIRLKSSIVNKKRRVKEELTKLSSLSYDGMNDRNAVQIEYLFSYAAHAGLSLLTNMRCENTVLPLTEMRESLITALVELVYYFNVPVPGAIQSLNFCGRLDNVNIIGELVRRHIVNELQMSIGFQTSTEYTLAPIGIAMAITGLTYRETILIKRRALLFTDIKSKYDEVVAQTPERAHDALNSLVLWLCCMFMFNSAGGIFDRRVDEVYSKESAEYTRHKFTRSLQKENKTLKGEEEEESKPPEKSDFESGLANAVDESFKKFFTDTLNVEFGVEPEDVKLDFSVLPDGTVPSEDFQWEQSYKFAGPAEKIELFFKVSKARDVKIRFMKDAKFKLLFLTLRDLLGMEPSYNEFNTLQILEKDQMFKMDVTDEVLTFTRVTVDVLENITNDEAVDGLTRESMKILLSAAQEFYQNVKLNLNPVNSFIYSILQGTAKDRIVAKNIKAAFKRERPLVTANEKTVLRYIAEIFDPKTTFHNAQWIETRILKNVPRGPPFDFSTFSRDFNESVNRAKYMLAGSSQGNAFSDAPGVLAGTFF